MNIPHGVGQLSADTETQTIAVPIVHMNGSVFGEIDRIHFFNCCYCNVLKEIHIASPLEEYIIIDKNNNKFFENSIKKDKQYYFVYCQTTAWQIY
jgi:hypothetical protein